MTFLQFLVLVWCVSAAVCFEAYTEALKPKEDGRWTAILIGSLTPVFNTLIALCYARDKLKGS